MPSVAKSNMCTRMGEGNMEFGNAVWFIQNDWTHSFEHSLVQDHVAADGVATWVYQPKVASTFASIPLLVQSEFWTPWWADNYTCKSVCHWGRVYLLSLQCQGCVRIQEIWVQPPSNDRSVIGSVDLLRWQCWESVICAGLLSNIGFATSVSRE